MPTFKSCPFCGEADIEIFHQLVTYYASCRSCGASGPSRATESGAFYAWNDRKEMETDDDR